jgi:hypothetical protein
MMMEVISFFIDLVFLRRQFDQSGIKLQPLCKMFYR